jgi:hypothetical protein
MISIKAEVEGRLAAAGSSIEEVSGSDNLNAVLAANFSLLARVTPLSLISNE